MALPAYISKSEIEWLFNSTRSTSDWPARDLMLLALYFGTPCTTLELNRIQIGDVLSKTGGLNRKFEIRGGLAYNNSPRDVYLTNERLKGFVEGYLMELVSRRLAMGHHPDRYMGLDPDSPLILTRLGGEYSILRRRLKSGNISYTCSALNRHIKTLMKKGGIEQPSTLSGRRTFAVNLKRKGFDLAHIHHLLGYSKTSLDATIKLLTTDPVDMGAIAAQAF